MVGSSTAYGWVMADVSASGSETWHTNGTIQQPGAATAVTIDENGYIYVAGNNGGSNMMVAKFNINDGSLNLGFNNAGVGGEQGILPIYNTGTTADATCIFAEPDPDSDVVVGGYTEYSSGSGTASDFTVVRLTRTGTYVTGFGNYDSTHATSRANFAYCNPSACGGQSTDAAYSLAEWHSGSGNYIYAAGVTNAVGGNHFAVARFDQGSGALDTSWGFTNGEGTQSGMMIGRAGVAYAIGLPGGLSDSNGYFVVAGVYSGTGKFCIDAYDKTGADYNVFDSGSTNEITDTFGGSSVTSLDSLNIVPVSGQTYGDIEISGVNPTACSYDIGLAEYSFS